MNVLINYITLSLHVLLHRLTHCQLYGMLDMYE